MMMTRCLFMASKGQSDGRVFPAVQQREDIHLDENAHMKPLRLALLTIGLVAGGGAVNRPIDRAPSVSRTRTPH